MSLPILDEIKSILDFFINNIPKPLQILLLIFVGGLVLGVGVPALYNLSTDYTCADGELYFNNGRCDATLTIYDYYSSDSNITWWDKSFTWVYLTFYDPEFIDEKGNVINPEDLRQYDREYWVDIACEKVVTDFEGKPLYNIDAENISNTVFYPICEGNDIKPSVFGQDIFNFKNFTVLMLLIYFVMLVFYFFK